MDMKSRVRANLSHLNHIAMKVGRLNTVMQPKVLAAGESIEMNMVGNVRLAPLVRHIAMDAKVTMAIFFTPFRQIYSDWQEFIKEGINEDVNFPTVSSDGDQRYYLGFPRSTYPNFTDMPLWVPACYNKVWSQYWRAPSDPAGDLADDFLASAEQSRRYGLEITPLDALTTQLLDTSREVSAALYEVDTSGGVLDLQTMQNIQSALGNTITRQYFANRYRDIIGKMGGYVNENADNRPTLIDKKEFWLSGTDVNGTDSSTLGKYAGKSAASFDWNLRRWLAPEHGVITMVATLRYPPVYEEEMHYLLRRPNPSYLEIGGDPELLAAQKPIIAKKNQFFADPGVTNLGLMPYNAWSFYHPSYVHGQIDNANSFPYIRSSPVSWRDANYVDSSDYDQTFSGPETFGHAQIIMANDMAVWTHSPQLVNSMTVGTK